MARHLRARNRGQSFTEYAILGTVALLAVLGMMTYVRRGVQAAVKASADDLLRMDEADTTGELTQQRAMPRPAEQDQAQTQHQATGTQTVAWAGGRQTTNGTSIITRTTQEQYLELNGPHTGGSSGGTATLSTGNPWTGQR